MKLASPSSNTDPIGDAHHADRLRIAAAVTIALPRTATSIAAGSYHDCAILDDGEVWCWGWNAYGQLGTGVAQDMTSLVPQHVLCF